MKSASDDVKDEVAFTYLLARLDENLLEAKRDRFASAGEYELFVANSKELLFGTVRAALT